ncbi:MAG: hypothetical protein HDR20_08065 [Lachnospiraceae bacterium]|nr:hypothetical protein [Lachnospiraceae bacterium]
MLEEVNLTTEQKRVFDQAIAANNHTGAVHGGWDQASNGDGKNHITERRTEQFCSSFFTFCNY